MGFETIQFSGFTKLHCKSFNTGNDIPSRTEVKRPHMKLFWKSNIQFFINIALAITQWYFKNSFKNGCVKGETQSVKENCSDDNMTDFVLLIATLEGSWKLFTYESLGHILK